MSSIPLTGDSQTDSDILAFIKARQNILQKKCKNIPWKPAKAHIALLFSPTLGGSRKLQRKEGATAVVWVASCELSPASPSPGADVWVAGLGAPAAPGQALSPYSRPWLFSVP